MQLSNNDGDVTIGELEVLNSTSTGIDIQVVAAKFFSPSPQSYRTPPEPASAFKTKPERSTSPTSMWPVTAKTALFVRGSDQVIVAGGTLRATNAGAAADIETSVTDISLTSIFSDGGPFGLRIVNSDGSFIVFGDGDEGTGGLIQNATTGILLDNMGLVALQGR